MLHDMPAARQPARAGSAVVLAVSAVLGSFAIGSSAGAEVLARWIALGPQDRAEVRAITNEADCRRR